MTNIKMYDHVMCDGSHSLLSRILYCLILTHNEEGRTDFTRQWLSEELSSNTAQIGIEINRLCKAGLLKKKQRGRTLSNTYEALPWPTDKWEELCSKRKNSF